MGKSRLSPLKPVTIPRMELSAAVLSTRLDKMLRQEIDFPSIIHFIGRTALVSWATSLMTRRGTRRSSLIGSLLSTSNHPQISGGTLGQRLTGRRRSRGLTAKAIIRSNCWTKGPEFLWLCQENWHKIPTAISEEIKEAPTEDEVTTAFATSTPPEEYDITEVFKRFSS